jgi:hypothetical protein
MHDIREGAELPRCEVCKGTHGVWIVVPVECIVVERLLPKVIHGNLRPMQRGKVFVDLVEDLLQASDSGRLLWSGSNCYSNILDQSEFWMRAPKREAS